MDIYSMFKDLKTQGIDYIYHLIYRIYSQFDRPFFCLFHFKTDKIQMKKFMYFCILNIALIIT